MVILVLVVWIIPKLILEIIIIDWEYTCLKAVGLLSGGLDSTLAVKLMLEQGFDIIAVNFTSPFCLCNSGGNCWALKVAKDFKIPIKVFNKGPDYLEVIKNPKYGYGSGMNPCIDCRIYMLKKAKNYSKEIGAEFLFTGEVLDERPMSQNMRALKIIEKEVGLEDKIVRPLSAKLLPETEAERMGWIDRKKLLNIRGRSRKKQIMSTKQLGIVDYPCPAGGCLLTYKEFATKVRDLIYFRKRITTKDILLLKVGRHFRFGKNKIIVGRNETENKRLLELSDKHDYLFEVPDLGSPITFLQGRKSKKAIELSAQLTARYSDAEGEEIPVKYYNKHSKHLIYVKPIEEDTLYKLRI